MAVMLRPQAVRILQVSVAVIKVLVALLPFTEAMLRPQAEVLVRVLVAVIPVLVVMSSFMAAQLMLLALQLQVSVVVMELMEVMSLFMVALLRPQADIEELVLEAVNAVLVVTLR